MTSVKRNNLKAIRIGIISLILLVFVVYYISYSFLWKNFGSNNEFDHSPILGKDLTVDLSAQLLHDSKTKVFCGEKLIHLDLKGAPPLVSYLKEFFPYIKKLGATGVLIEYEDMFFYKDQLEDIRALNAYEPSTLNEILELANFNNLSVVPLIQTFGHFEFVLKLEKYKDMREINEYPQVLCPSHERVLFFIKKMIDQILEAHPKAKYIHIGCDEVLYLGKCKKCKSIMHKNYWTTAQLFLNHVKTIAMYINETYPGVRPIIWGDMIGEFNEKIVENSKISSLVDLMVWKYAPNVKDYITENLLRMYAKVFKTIWIASAFKGATGVNQIKTDVSYHIANHVAWLKIVEKWKNHLNFKGIAITGWQRYDHFAELCELLPVAIPSLTSCLYYLNNSEEGVDENKIIKYLQCDPIYENSLFKFTYSTKLERCNFPGYSAYNLINKVSDFSSKINTHFSVIFNGWFSPYNILHKFSSPAYVSKIFYKWPLNKNRLEFMKLEEDLKTALSDIYDEFTIKEWFTNNIIPIRLKLEAFYRAKEVLLSQKVWPRRPFLNNTDDLEKAAQEICTFERDFGCALLLI